MFNSKFLYTVYSWYTRNYSSINQRIIAHFLSGCVARLRRNLYFNKWATNDPSFDGMCPRERRDKRESFIVRARLILHHRQSRESPGRQSLGVAMRSHKRIPGGGKLCYGVYLQLGITCRINTVPARGISERRHELRITACTRARKSNPPMWNSYVRGTGL